MLWGTAGALAERISPGAATGAVGLEDESPCADIPRPTLISFINFPWILFLDFFVEPMVRLYHTVVSDV
jgi:hypothetical protein